MEATVGELWFKWIYQFIGDGITGRKWDTKKCLAIFSDQILELNQVN